MRSMLLILMMSAALTGCEMADVAPAEQTLARGVERDAFAPSPATTIVIPPAAAHPLTASLVLRDNLWRFGGPETLLYPVVVPVGCMLRSWSARVTQAGADPLFGVLQTTNPDDTVGFVGATASTSGVGDATLADVVDEPIAARDYMIRVFGGSAGASVREISVAYACPMTLAPTSSTLTVSIDAAAASALAYGGGPTFDGNEWILGSLLVPIRYPLPVITGDTITGYRVFIRKGAPYPVSAYLESANGFTGARESLAVAATTTTGGIVTAEISGLQIQTQPGTAYSIRLYGNGLVAGDVAMNAAVDLVRR